ncbi:MAG: bacteriohemerythrin [Proteobacteria bacterium]|nr:bacteriohemerythrin [Pseudomonadota bacterium]
MSLIKWSSELSVEIEIIDAQHKKLIAMINKLDAAMRLGKGRDLTEKILDELVEYTRKHFSAEEEYFTKFGYPFTAQHVKEHIAFIKKIEKFQANFEKEKLTLSTKIVDFLSDWLRDHIQGTDKKYIRFFHDKGLK